MTKPRKTVFFKMPPPGKEKPRIVILGEFMAGDIVVLATGHVGKVLDNGKREGEGSPVYSVFVPHWGSKVKVRESNMEKADAVSRLAYMGTRTDAES